MGEFEEACARTESRANDLLRSAKAIERAAKLLARASADGDHAKVVKALDEARGALDTASVVGSSVASAWPYDDDRLSAYLEQGYEQELIELAGSRGTAISRLDDRLAAFPVVIQIQPKQRAVRLDATRIPALRPSALVERIEAQRKKAGAKPEQFIEILYKTYDRVGATGSQGKSLADIYDTLTLLPESRRNYSRAEFARDIFLLDSSNVGSTKTGATVSFPAATGTKGSSKTFVVVPPDGMPKHYVSIRFKEAGA